MEIKKGQITRIFIGEIITPEMKYVDSCKTTLTEKFLLYGGAINLAGTVKGRKATKHAVSDWMEIEKERALLPFRQWLS